MLNVAIIGTGVHGSRYAAHLTRATDPLGLRLRGIYRRDDHAARRQATLLKCLAYPNLEALFEDTELDAVILASPPDSHADLVQRAVRAGLPCLVEKPYVSSSANWIDSPLVMVAHTLRFHPAIHGCAPPTKFIRFFSCLPKEDRFRNGALLDHGVHYFDALRYLTGEEVRAVRCALPVIDSRGLETRFNAHLTFDSFHTTVRFRTGDSRQQTMSFGPLEINLLSWDEPTIRATLIAFRDAILERRPFPVTARDGLEAVRIAEMCRLSRGNEVLIGSLRSTRTQPDRKVGNRRST